MIQLLDFDEQTVWVAAFRDSVRQSGSNFQRNLADADRSILSIRSNRAGAAMATIAKVLRERAA